MKKEEKTCKIVTYLLQSYLRIVMLPTLPGSIREGRRENATTGVYCGMKRKRWISLLLVLCLLTGGRIAAAETPEDVGSGAAPVSAESEEPEEGDDSEVMPLEEGEIPDDGDDSEQVPLDIMDEDDLEESEYEWRILQYGDEGDDVLELQTRLRDLKYYTGNLSGRYREGTREAVKVFQSDFDLEATGIADIQTQAVLYSTQYRPLRYGSSGEDVKTLQTRLTDLGYYKGKISGNYLEGTRSAVRKFQEKNNLEADGAADPDTQTMIYSPTAIGKNDGEPTPTPSPKDDSYLVDEEMENISIRMPDGTVPFTKKLKNGSTGKLVKELQERLTALGYYDGPISGNFMKNTTRAVKKIQTQNGLKATGTVDEETWNVIFNDAKVVLPKDTPKPTPSPTPVPFAITVDVANQVTTVYGRDEYGDYTVVVRQMLCSTGMKATPSDVGDWVLNGRHAQWCVFPKWANSYARYWTRINGSIAFHSVLYYAVSNTAMNTGSYKKLGQRASHGCVRLTVADAKWIYDNVGAGTVVSIVEGMPADPELRDALKLAPLNTKTMTPYSTPVPTAEPEYKNSVKPEIGNRTLKERSEDANVFWVQKRLAELGYYKGKCSGKFLSGTKRAVIAFQKDHKIYANGQVDQKTIDAMYEAETPTRAPRATETPAPDGT